MRYLVFKIIKKISLLTGGILLIDYGYLQSQNLNTLQSIKKHKKNNIFKNIYKADITYLVNFNLLNEYFLKNHLKTKKIVTQKFFLEKIYGKSDNKGTNTRKVFIINDKPIQIPKSRI